MADEVELAHACLERCDADDPYQSGSASDLRELIKNAKRYKAIADRCSDDHAKHYAASTLGILEQRLADKTKREAWWRFGF